MSVTRTGHGLLLERNCFSSGNAALKGPVNFERHVPRLSLSMRPVNPGALCLVNPWKGSGTPYLQSALRPLKSLSVRSCNEARPHGSPSLIRCSSTSGNRPGPEADDVLKAVTQALWGKGLPPGALVGVVREGWTAGWKVMMSQLAPQSKTGGYQRPPSAFRSKVEPGGPFPPAPGRYHLYAALSCPWAHRALLVHALKGLGDAVPLSIAVPGGSGLWEFRLAGTPGKATSGNGRLTAEAEGIPKNGAPGAAPAGGLRPTADRAHGCERVRDVYRLRKGGYDGRATVPMLWDSHSREVVNNESADIIEVLNSAFNGFAANPDLDLAPAHTRAEMERWNEEIYNNVNNGVYRCGFATSQVGYTEAVQSLFATLDRIDRHLATHRYLCGDHLTLADIRLFTTLYRFDAAYSPLFKCSRQKVAEYEHLSGYLRDVYQIPGIAATCDMEAVMASYFGTLFPLNPGGIIPVMPLASSTAALLKPHGRAALVEGPTKNEVVATAS